MHEMCFGPYERHTNIFISSGFVFCCEVERLIQVKLFSIFIGSYASLQLTDNPIVIMEMFSYWRHL